MVVALLAGGDSAEREISIASGRAVEKALRDSRKYDVRVYDPARHLASLVRDRGRIDVVLPLLHGPGGEDGRIQGFLETLGLPYAFSGVEASAIGMDKLRTRKLLAQAGIPVPKTIALDRQKNVFDMTLWPGQQTLPQPTAEKPLVVKPNGQGSSVGVSIVRTDEELRHALEEAFHYDPQTALVEEYIPGLEVTCGVIGERGSLQPLPVVEIHPMESETFFSYKAKYDPATQEIVPAKISTTLTQTIQEISTSVFALVGCRGVARIDSIIRGEEPRVRKEGDVNVLEINTIPGFTEHSLIPKEAKAFGWTFLELIEKLIEIALKEGRGAPATKT